MVKPATTAVLVVLAAASGWVVGSASPARPGYVALMSALVAVEATVIRIALGEGDADAGRGWMWVEAAGLAVGAKVVHLLTIGATAATVELATGRLVDPETVTGWVVGGLVWGLAHASLHDFDLLGYPGDGPADPGPVVRLRARFFRVGFLLVVAGSVAVAGVGGIVDIDRAPIPGPLVPLLVYFVVGLASLGRSDLRHEEQQWRRDGARIDADLSSRWSGVLALVVGAVLVVGLAVPPRASGMGGLTPALTRVAAGLGRSAVDWLSGFGDGGATGRPGDGSPASSALPAAGSRRGDPGADLVRDVAMLLVLAAGLGLAFIRFERRRGGDVRGSAGSVLAALWRLVRDGFVALVRALVRLFRGVGSLLGGKGEVAARPGVVEGGDGGWVPPDEIRRRIAAEYRGFLATTGTVVGTRRPAETSGEYAARVAEQIPDPGPVRRLTGIFDLARYTRRSLPSVSADEAAEARRRVETQFGGEGHGLR